MNKMFLIGILASAGPAVSWASENPRLVSHTPTAWPLISAMSNNTRTGDDVTVVAMIEPEADSVYADFQAEVISLAKKVGFNLTFKEIRRANSSLNDYSNFAAECIRVDTQVHADLTNGAGDTIYPICLAVLYGTAYLRNTWGSVMYGKDGVIHDMTDTFKSAPDIRLAICEVESGEDLFQRYANN